ncbi:MAG: hypothetical protein WA081_19650 [Desulfosalsimonadaceae bacterium]
MVNKRLILLNPTGVASVYGDSRECYATPLVLTFVYGDFSQGMGEKFFAPTPPHTQSGILRDIPQDQLTYSDGRRYNPNDQ